MNQLRLLKLEELRRRDFVDTTVRSSLHGVATSAGYFRENPSTMLNSIPTAVHHVDSGVALAQPKTLDEVVEESMPDQRFTLILFTSFAAVAEMWLWSSFVPGYVVLRRWHNPVVPGVNC